MNADLLEFVTLGPSWVLQDPRRMQRFAEAYKTETGEDICNACPSTIASIIESLSLTSNLTRMSTETATQAFRLKDGIRLEIAGDPTVYTNANLTDESAVEILARVPGCLSRFQTVPDDWKDRVAKYKDRIRKRTERTPSEPKTDAGASSTQTGKTTGKAKPGPKPKDKATPPASTPPEPDPISSEPTPAE